MTKHITLCADDFGINAAVSQGIINLVSQKRLSATSCMTNYPSFQTHISELLKFREQIDLGLHFNLLSPKLSKIILLSYLRQLKIKDIEAELQSQIDNFKKSVGTLPDYIDGHQHIQQLPIIRNAIINVIKRNYSDKLPYLRIPSNGFFKSIQTSAKALLIHLLGAGALLKLTNKNHIPTNSSFAGFSDFNPAQDYATQFESYLQQVKDNGLIMCHPGLANPFDPTDSIAKSRVKEYEFFSSTAFTELLTKYDTKLIF